MKRWVDDWDDEPEPRKKLTARQKAVAKELAREVGREATYDDNLQVAKWRPRKGYGDDRYS